jgi:hypothetical protein
MVQAIAKSVGALTVQRETMHVWKNICFGKYSTIWLEIDLRRFYSHSTYSSISYSVISRNFGCFCKIYLDFSSIDYFLSSLFFYSSFSYGSLCAISFSLPPSKSSSASSCIFYCILVFLFISTFYYFLSGILYFYWG